MIAAVVVTFSVSAEMLDRCLRALHRPGGPDRIVVVDTGGAAVVADDLADVVELVRTENRGYGAAANLGFDMLSESDAVVLLNDDVIVRPGWLPPLVDELSPSDVGAVQPVLVTGEDTVTSLGVTLDRYGAGTDIGDGSPTPTDVTPADLSLFNGGTVLFDMQFVRETGGFDERFFLYYEDVDLALRGRALGWRFRVAPASVVEHRRGTSTGRNEARTRLLQERNRLWLAFRFGTPRVVVRAVGLSVRRLRHEPKDVHRRALAAGLAGAPRRIVERVRRVNVLGRP